VAPKANHPPVETAEPAPAKNVPESATAKAAPAADATASAAPSPAAARPAPAAPAPSPDERINSYLDELRVTAVRIQGNDSRVMINERVFRLNDIVDRHLGIRLTKVEANQIIFTDANGVAYVKYF
jgi:hypothetical protein